ncbi:type ISP restriction/modification enzyme, partial [Campylobacter troglodytis]|uniref:type ISP restriction/modification enzyme n=1 Tax=Campylobacter troglodytis TaxID=654363 RepID=UPI0031F3E59B
FTHPQTPSAREGASFNATSQKPFNLAKVLYHSTKDSAALKRKDKFALLNDIAQNGLNSVKWQELTHDEPYFWFVPKSFENAEYEDFWALAANKAMGESKAIFENFSSGIQTKRDETTIQFTKKQMQGVLQDFAILDKTALASKYNIHDSRDWQIERAKAEVISTLKSPPPLRRGVWGVGEKTQNSQKNSQNSLNLNENSQGLQNDNFANAKFTHPQTPSAREGASFNATSQKPFNLAKVLYHSTKDSAALKRKDKFALLNDIAQNGLNSVKWQELTLDEPYFWFVPKSFENAEYENFWALAANKAMGESKAIFENFSSGIQTKRDETTIQFTKKQMQGVLQDFAILDKTALASKYNIHDSRDWQIERAKAEVISTLKSPPPLRRGVWGVGEKTQNSQKNSQNSLNLNENSQGLQNDNFANAKFTHPQTPSAREGAYNATLQGALQGEQETFNITITQIAYRPFDTRYTFTSGKTKGFLRRSCYETMQHFVKGENLGLCFPKTCLNSHFDYGLIINTLADRALGGAKTGSETYISPLYRYDEIMGDKEGEVSKIEKIPNFTSEFSEFKEKSKLL